MKNLLSNRKKMMVSVGLLAIGAVIGIGGATFAAIPHSATKEISACRNTTDGALRVIDAEANETCTTGETALTWSGVRSAVARFDYSSEDPEGIGVYNALRSRNIGAEKIATYVMDENNTYGPAHCIHLDFTPKFISPAPQYSILETDEWGGGELVPLICGPGYEYVFMGVVRASVFFTE